MFYILSIYKPTVIVSFSRTFSFENVVKIANFGLLTVSFLEYFNPIEKNGLYLYP